MAITAGQLAILQGAAGDMWEMKILTPVSGDILYFNGTNWIASRVSTKRTYSTTSTATLTPEIASYDAFELTAQAEALTVANHSTSTPTNFEQIKISITDNGTARALTFGTNYVAGTDLALPNSTIAGKEIELMFEWRTAISKYRLMAIWRQV